MYLLSGAMSLHHLAIVTKPSLSCLLCFLCMLAIPFLRCYICAGVATPLFKRRVWLRQTNSSSDTEEHMEEIEKEPLAPESVSSTFYSMEADCVRESRAG